MREGICHQCNLVKLHAKAGRQCSVLSLCCTVLCHNNDASLTFFGKPIALLSLLTLCFQLDLLLLLVLV